MSIHQPAQQDLVERSDSSSMPGSEANERKRETVGVEDNAVIACRVILELDEEPALDQIDPGYNDSGVSKNPDDPLTWQ